MVLGSIGDAVSDPSTRLRKSQDLRTVVVMSTPIDRVRELLSRRDMSQSQLAEVIGLDASKMSKSLSGQRRFSSLEYAQIAEACYVSTDWLLTGADDRVAMAARAESGSNTADATAQARRFVELAEVAEELGRAWTRPPVEIGPLTGRWREDGERLAEAAGHVSGAADLVGAVDLAGGIERVFAVDVGIVDLGDAVDGLCAVQGSSCVLLAAPNPIAARQRFTLAHELGHALAGDDAGLRVDVDVYNPGRDGSEQRANAFAAAFLMPADALTTRLNDVDPVEVDREMIASIALDLKVSPGALVHRLEGLRIIDGMTASRLGAMSMKEAQVLTGRGAEWQPVIEAATSERRPELLGADLYRAYLEGRTTLRPYARLMDVDVEILRASVEEADG